MVQEEYSIQWNQSTRSMNESRVLARAGIVERDSIYVTYVSLSCKESIQWDRDLTLRYSVQCRQTVVTQARMQYPLQDYTSNQ